MLGCTQRLPYYGFVFASFHHFIFPAGVLCTKRSCRFKWMKIYLNQLSRTKEHGPRETTCEKLKKGLVPLQYLRLHSDSFQCWVIEISDLVLGVIFDFVLFRICCDCWFWQSGFSLHLKLITWYVYRDHFSCAFTLLCVTIMSSDLCICVHEWFVAYEPYQWVHGHISLSSVD